MIFIHGKIHVIYIHACYTCYISILIEGISMSNKWFPGPIAGVAAARRSPASARRSPAAATAAQTPQTYVSIHVLAACRAWHRYAAGRPDGSVHTWLAGTFFVVRGGGGWFKMILRCRVHRLNLRRRRPSFLMIRRALSLNAVTSALTAALTAVLTASASSFPGLPERDVGGF